jgi:hypothetical protein
MFESRFEADKDRAMATPPFSVKVYRMNHSKNEETTATFEAVAMNIAENGSLMITRPNGKAVHFASGTWGHIDVVRVRGRRDAEHSDPTHS